MKFRHLLIVTGLFLAGIMAFQNCGALSGDGTVHGTEIGNPFGTGSDTASPVTQAATSILNASCQVLVKCHPSLTVASCTQFFGEASGVGAKLGLPSGQFDPYSQVILAESQGRIVANVFAVNACLTQIQALSCNQTSVVSAYSSTDTEPLRNVSLMIPTNTGSCPAVFSLSP